MTRPRRVQVDRHKTPFYHCVSRCVRRAYLCGKDRVSERSYDHRRAWIQKRLRKLASLFAIDVCAYAIMSNHYHLVLRLGSSEDWSDDEVIARWLALYKGPLLVHRYVEGAALSEAQSQTVREIVTIWRRRLQDLSWFMKCLNEPIARQANEEDGCKGHFWEARFKTQALSDETSLLSCMAYVDLNPLRAGYVKAPEQADYTSLKSRICTPGAEPVGSSGFDDSCTTAATSKRSIIPLVPFSEGEASTEGALPMTLANYLQLVDWSGRQVREDKAGFIAASLPPILERLAMRVDETSKWRNQHELPRRFGVSRWLISGQNGRWAV